MAVGLFRRLRPVVVLNPIAPPEINATPAVPEDGIILVPVVGQSWVARVEGGTWDLATYEQNNQFVSARTWVKPDQTLTDNGDWEFINETPNNANPPGFGGSQIRPVIIQMASLLESAYPGNDIRFVFYGLGGTGLNEAAEWAVGGTLRRLYIEFMLRPALTSLATLGLPVRVLPLMTAFGHADAEVLADAQQYANRLLLDSNSLVEEIKTEFNIPNLPVGIFRLRDNWAARTGEFPTIDAQIELMLQEENTFPLDADNYADGDDGLHLGSIGTRQLAIDHILQGLQQGLSVYSASLTLLSATLIGTGGEPGQVITLTFNKTLQVTPLPAVGDFALSEGRTVTNVEISGQTVQLDIDTPFNIGDTITLGHTPGVNPITTGAETVTAFTDQAVANNLVTPVSSGTVLTFTTSANMTATGDPVVYTAATGGGNYRWIAVADTTIPANTDGSVEVDLAGTQSVLGFDDDNTNEDFNDGDGYNAYVWVLNGNFYTRTFNTSSIDSGVAYQSGDLLRMRRTGTDIFAEYSRDAGDNWVVLNTFAGADIGLATEEVFVKVNLNQNGQSFTNAILR
ncbi:MAG: sialate O-acetylesterase [Cyanobacteria bacterium P01_H01_bin.105]